MFAVVMSKVAAPAWTGSDVVENPIVYRRNPRIASFRYQKSRPVQRKWFDTFVDQPGAGQSISPNGTVVIPSANLLTSGSGKSEVIGRKILVKSFHMRCTIKFPSQVRSVTEPVSEDSYVRIQVICDTQANGSALTVQELMQQTTAEGHVKLDNSLRFVVLAESYVKVHRNRPVLLEDTSTGFKSLIWGFSDVEMAPINLSNVNKEILFGPTPSGNISDVMSGNFVVVMYSSDEQPGMVLPQASVMTRLRYTDH